MLHHFLEQRDHEKLTLHADNCAGQNKNKTVVAGHERDQQQHHTNRLLTAFGKPLISTSANISGEAYPRNKSELDPRILNGVDYALILPSNPPMTGKPSSIIKLGTGGEVKIIRN